MAYVVFDAETYYDREYSLRKMTPPEYIMDPRFEVMGAGVVEQGGKPKWLNPYELQYYLDTLGSRRKSGEKITVISHNALFDMCILAWRYGFVPDLMVDTMSMARACVFAFIGRVSLEAVAEYFKLPPKGDAIKHVSGMRAADIKAKGLWDTYTAYAKHDAYLCEQIFLRLAKVFPREEYAVMDMVIRCAVLPRFELDVDLLAQHKADIERQKEELLWRCGLSDRKDLMSNEKFAQALRALGIEPPMKSSPTTGLDTYAFAKSDPAMIDLADHPSPQVQALVAARVGHKSTLEETRTQRLLNIALLDGLQRRAPIALRYSGAHTHRLSGEWGMNAQNWPRDTLNAEGKKEAGKLRRAHKAPTGYRVVKCDAAQIEARIAAWLVGQSDLVEMFRNGEDIYSDFAEKNVYHYPVNKKTPDERFVGKNAILGLGFQVGAQKFKKELAAKSFVTLGHSIVLDLPVCQNIVSAYRTRFSQFPKGWDTLKNLIPYLSREDSGVEFGPVVFEHQAVRLPNGHRLFYHNLQFTTTDNGEMQWMFEYGKKRKKLYGGKLFENCLATDTLVLTPNGWDLITNVDGQPVWDGMEWVSHCGVVQKGSNTVAPLDGVKMTEDHKVLTEESEWVNASNCCGLTRKEISLPDGGAEGRFASWQAFMAYSMRLREYLGDDIERVRESEAKVLRVQALRTNQECQIQAWALAISTICSMELHGAEVPEPKTPRLSQIRGERDNSLPTVADVRRVLGRYGFNLPEWPNLGEDQKQSRVPSAELHLDRLEISKPQYAGQPNGQYPRRGDATCRSVRTFGHWGDNPLLPDRGGVADNSPVRQARSYEPVVDILNCGPRNQFVVLGDTGPFIVHNCVQALARVITMSAAIRLQHVHPLAHQVHDDLVYVVPEDEAEGFAQLLEHTMSTGPAWAAGLPLAAEKGIGLNYGDAK